MGSIYVICSRQCPNGDGIYTLLNALYKYSTSITNQPTNRKGGIAPQVCYDKMSNQELWQQNISGDGSFDYVYLFGRHDGA